MKGKYLIKLIQENELENFEIVVRFSEIKENQDYPLNVRTFEIESKLCDIAYSDRKGVLSILEIL